MTLNGSLTKNNNQRQQFLQNTFSSKKLKPKKGDAAKAK
jgi:hypothetical protein